jgi:AraC family transcriptional regulator
MIYREMPATWEPAFRTRFYLRWGKENAVISARTRQAEYPNYKQLLSVKAVYGGVENYFIDGRHIAVDDETFWIVNGERSYASCIQSLDPTHSFSVFFDRRLVNQTWEALRNARAVLLDDVERTGNGPPEFSERLHPHDTLVTPVLKHIQRNVDAGMEDEVWIEEQLIFLFQRMLTMEGRLQERDNALARKRSTRRELDRRLALGVDFICTRFREPISLQQIAAAAHLSPYYFLRQFRSVYGCSPGKFIQQRRCRAALQLLRQSDWTTAVIAEHVGFGTRSSLCRRIKAQYGVEPRSLRQTETQV